LQSFLPQRIAKPEVNSEKIVRFLSVMQIADIHDQPNLICGSEIS